MLTRRVVSISSVAGRTLFVPGQLGSIAIYTAELLVLAPSVAMHTNRSLQTASYLALSEY